MTVQQDGTVLSLVAAKIERDVRTTIANLGKLAIDPKSELKRYLLAKLEAVLDRLEGGSATGLLNPDILGELGAELQDVMLLLPYLKVDIVARGASDCFF